MPLAVADAVLGDRAEMILGLARHAFVEKGFDGASMQDLARAAGMSAGNFYRYFPSKAALVEALIARDLAEVEDAFRLIASSPDPLGALKGALAARLAENCEEDAPLWAEIMAAAARKPEIAALLQRMEDGILERIVRVLALVGGMPEAEAARRFDAHVRIIFILIRGAALERPAGQPPNDDLNALILRTIDRLLDEALVGTGSL
jgi:AcrR family transcriptional regulator